MQLYITHVSNIYQPRCEIFFSVPFEKEQQIELSHVKTRLNLPFSLDIVL